MDKTKPNNERVKYFRGVNISMYPSRVSLVSLLSDPTDVEGAKAFSKLKLTSIPTTSKHSKTMKRSKKFKDKKKKLKRGKKK